MALFKRSIWGSLILALVSSSSAAAEPARMHDGQPESTAERRSRLRVEKQSCPQFVGVVFPGVSQFCLGKTAEGVVFSALGATELGVGVAALAARDEGLSGLDHPAAAIPLASLQYLWIYSYLDGVFERQRAAHLRYVPLDTAAELALAPFNPRVLAHTDVWAGTLVALALGVSASVLVDGGWSGDHFGDDPVLFGRRFSGGVGYPLAGAVGAGFFSHVAVAEESMFRGLVQSQMSREMDPTSGWIGSSLAFGVAHAPNVIGLDQRRQLKYLTIGVPFITMLGGYIGHTYRHHGYSLAPPVAIHFWYDLLLSAIDFARDPRNSSISARMTMPF